MPAITVCICTFRRSTQLAALLGDLNQQTLLPDEVVVVDNDAPGTAREAVDALRPTLKYALRYDVQPLKNISLTRNQTVALATGEWLAFLDDDERVTPEWLATLWACKEQFTADGVVGRVHYRLPPEAAAWLQRGNFYGSRPRQPTGTVLSARDMGIGNVLLRARDVRAQEGPFNPRFGLTGGEDGDFLARLVASGAKIVWSEEGVADEWVEPARLSLRWLMLRALRGGQDYAHHRLGGRFGPMNSADKLVFLGDAAAKASVAALLAGPATLGGVHRGVHYLQKCVANLGKLSAFLGMHYREYG